MTALEKALETVKEKQKELRKLRGKNSESTSQGKVESPRDVMKILSMDRGDFLKGLHPYPSFLRGHNRIMPALQKEYGYISYPDDRKKNDMKTRGMTNFGAGPRLRPSTMQTCPPFLHRLQVSSSFGKSHFIC
jgi:hypothetical protein